MGELMCSTRPYSRNGDGREGRKERENGKGGDLV